MKNIGVLLTNTGTPDEPTPLAVRRYLKEFLADRRIVQLPRLIWLPILYALILPFRSHKSAKLYSEIWTTAGAPMRVIMHQLKDSLSETLSDNFFVDVAMNYGSPSIAEKMHGLLAKQLDQLIVLPLFPQFSHTTTSSSFDRVKRALKSTHKLPEISYISHYCDQDAYINALRDSIQSVWQQSNPRHLVISFHGIPKRYVAKGDPYQKECELTATRLVKQLKLHSNQWSLCYQSQFGYDKWLQPSTQRKLMELPKQGHKNIDIICPGFAIDCLETLEEILLRGKKTFLTAGGENLRYIPALNDSPTHVQLLAQMIQAQI